MNRERIQEEPEDSIDESIRDKENYDEEINSQHSPTSPIRRRAEYNMIDIVKKNEEEFESEFKVAFEAQK
jgi:hypothetical protein